jgi:hypothetical protein
MSEVLTARRCRFEDVFDANFIELVQLVPGNPYVRALILRFAGKLPGPDCATFEQIKEWVEVNCEKQPRATTSRTTRQNAEGGITIHVDFSETECGRASYSVRRYGSEDFQLGAEALMEIVREAIADGDGLDKIVEAVADKIDEDAWSECDPSMDDSGDHAYSDHESGDTDDSEVNFSRPELRRAVLTFVRERHPELAAEL